MTIYTIGYEGMGVDGFLSLLHENDIETVVDVRKLPLSRKPGFSKKLLADILNGSGFAYIHLPDLGCPKPIRDRYRTNGNWEQYKDGFLKYLAAQEAAVAGLASMAADSNCALLCFEADYKYCHRTTVADAVNRLNGMRVSHIPVPKAGTANSAGLALVFA